MYSLSNSPGGGTSRTTLFGWVCQVAAPGEKSAVSDCILHDDYRLSVKQTEPADLRCENQSEN